MQENKEEKNVNLEEERKTEEVKENNKEVSIENESKTEKDKNMAYEQKDDTTFRKVEMKNKSMNNNSKKASHKVIKTILIIIMLLIGAYCIFFSRNLIILNNLKEATNQYKNITNYSYESINSTGNHLKYSENDNFIRLELQNEQNSESKMIIWQDKSTNEEIIAFEQKNTAIQSNQSSITVEANLPFTISIIGDEFTGLALYSLIYADNLNGRECYVIQDGLDLKMWVDKETGILYKQEYGEGQYVEVTNLELENVNEIYKPDLTGYEIKNMD